MREDRLYRIAVLVACLIGGLALIALVDAARWLFIVVPVCWIAFTLVFEFFVREPPEKGERLAVALRFLLCLLLIGGLVWFSFVR